MNDIELDEILNMWSVPEAPASLRERVRAGFGGRETVRDVLARWLSRRSLVGAAAVGLGAFLLMVTRAVPQTLSEVRPPYTVDSEFLRYADDGSAEVGMYSTSYNDQNGREVILSRSLPGNPLGTALVRTMDAARHFVNPLLLRLAFVSNSQLAIHKSIPTVSMECAVKSCLLVGSYSLPKAAANPGIGCVDGAVVDRETILNYPTAAVLVPLGTRRMTVWMAPALGCFALKIATEERQADGTFRLLSGKQAVRVTVNP